jgi:hypothetical protein
MAVSSRIAHTLPILTFSIYYYYYYYYFMHSLLQSFLKPYTNTILQIFIPTAIYAMYFLHNNIYVRL